MDKKIPRPTFVSHSALSGAGVADTEKIRVAVKAFNGHKEPSQSGSKRKKDTKSHK